MRWNNRDELTQAIEELDTTVHAGAPIAFSVRHCFAMVSDVVDLVWPELDRLRALVADLPAMKPGDSVRVTMTDDGTFDVVLVRPSAAAKEAWGAEMWVDAPEQENYR